MDIKSLKSILSISIFFALVFSSCVSTQQYTEMQGKMKKDLDAEMERSAKYQKDVVKCNDELNATMRKLSTAEANLKSAETALTLKEEQIKDLKAQLEDVKAQRDKQVTQVGNLAVLSQSANDNIKETLHQLESKDKYIYLLQNAKSKADSINLALAVNLKGVLSEGIEDKDVEIKVDKTVVFINLSDKMLYQSGSYNLTPKANEVLGKIAKIVESRPDFEVMVEGYTDNIPVKTSCLDDNWDLSVKRSTSVVRLLQNTYKIDPNRLIAAGRGQYNALASNDTPEGKATNRRTRIIILPKIDQFYDLLNPNLVPK